MASSSPSAPLPDAEPAVAPAAPPLLGGSPVGTKLQRLTDMRELFRLAFERHASDIHLTEHAPPLLRIHGDLQPTAMMPLTRAETKRLIYSILTDQQRAQFERDLELDMSIDVEGLGRFRVNVHLQRGSVEAALRLVASRIPSLQELGLPAIAAELARKPNGLVLVTGPTGSGKTTTLAAMVNLINHERSHHIILIEDPIEYVHTNVRSIIKQREVYSDTKSFANALMRALRQDPNIVVVGEMRDLDTISTTLTAAETGHLVLATLHTSDTMQTVNRIVDVFPASQQNQVRVQLSLELLGVVSQQLIPKADGRGRVLATEFLMVNHAVRSLIREQKIHQIYSVIQTGQKEGMRTMNQTLYELYTQRVITLENALGRSGDPDDLMRLMNR